jgi:uncharacterized membrane protein
LGPSPDEIVSSSMPMLGIVIVAAWLSSIGLVGVVIWAKRHDMSLLTEHHKTFQTVSRLWRVAGLIGAVGLIALGTATQHLLSPGFYVWLIVGIYVPIRVALGLVATTSAKARSGSKPG